MYTPLERFRKQFIRKGVSDWCASEECLEMFNKFAIDHMNLNHDAFPYVDRPFEKDVDYLTNVYIAIKMRLEIVDKICEHPESDFMTDLHVFEMLHFLLYIKETIEEDVKCWGGMLELYYSERDEYDSDLEKAIIKKHCERINKCISLTREKFAPLCVSDDDTIRAFNYLLYMNQDEVRQEQRSMYTYIEKHFRETNQKNNFDREDWACMMEVNLDYLKILKNGELQKLQSRRFEYDNRIEYYKSDSLQFAVGYISDFSPVKDVIKIKPWILGNAERTIPSSSVWMGFFMIMHRHIAIQCGLFPNLIPQYTALKYSESEKNTAKPVASDDKTQLLQSGTKAPGKPAKEVEFESSQAQKYWRKLREAGYVDNKNQLTFNIKDNNLNKAAYIALCFNEVLRPNLRRNWDYFKKLWGVEGADFRNADCVKPDGNPPREALEIDKCFS